jgi:2-polyprenyl-3-methyl-5-hydroxy-6-metoxy-1,4-benzoquinol methylase
MQVQQPAEDRRAHWDGVYKRNAPDAVSWYRPHLETSLRLIQDAAGSDSSILDVGGGHSILVDDLLSRGYRKITVLEVSEAALNLAKLRLGVAAEPVTWQVDDILTASLQEGSYDVWHDRAVFHFLTNPEQRSVYRRQATHALKPGGNLIIATFGPQGPMKCSGLEVCRYSAETLAAVLGSRFTLTESLIEIHKTTSGTEQQFLYCSFRFL